MKEYLGKLPQDVQGLIAVVKDTAKAQGVKAYLVGGFVRDLLLGVTNFDLDIAIAGDGIAFAQALASELHAHVITHRRFGTATVTVKPHTKIDISSTRKEIYPHPGSLPVVSGGTLEDDLFRRDFTINALAIDITGEDFGIVKDVYHGVRDLNEKKIRVLHEMSFIDDPTRILRAIRFQKRYNFSLERKTGALLKDALGEKLLERVEPQRLRDEIILMLKEKAPLAAIKRLEAMGGLGCVSSTIRLTATISRVFKAIDAQIQWFRLHHHHRRHLDTWLIYFLALIDSLGIEETKSLCKRFVFRKGEEKRILDFKRFKPGDLRILRSKPIPASRLFTMLEHVSYEILILLKAKYSQRYLQRNIETFLHTHEGVRVGLTGHDLQKLGVKPGPCYQVILRKLLLALLDGKIKGKEQELAMAQRMIASLTKRN